MSIEHAEDVEFHEGLKVIQSELRIYAPGSVLLESLKYLYAPAKNGTEKASRCPWLIMLLMKWTYLDPLVDSLLSRPEIESSQLVAILQKILDLSDQGKMPDEFDDVRLFMRALAYQQFFYQQENPLVDLARQELIFGVVPDNHYFKVQFKGGVGLSVGVFIRLAMMLVICVEKFGFSISRDTFFSLCSQFCPVDVDTFLRAVSVDASGLRQYLVESDKYGRGPDEFLQQTPFLQRPLIKMGAIYLCVSPHVLQKSLGHFIYDYLKRADVNGFNSPFGKSFEKYVGDCVAETGLEVVNESELIRFFSDSGGVVDYLVVDGESNILIDAKGVEMAHRGMVSVTRGDIRRATRTSLLKAFKQGHEVASRIPECSTHPTIRRMKENYLIVVTYKELYVGNGTMLEAVVGADELDKIRGVYAEEHLIPVQNMYFLTIHEFETLTSLVAEGKVGFVEAIEKAKKSDSQPYSQKFNFELHLKDLKLKLGSETPLIRTLKKMQAELVASISTRSAK